MTSPQSDKLASAENVERVARAIYDANPMTDAAFFEDVHRHPGGSHAVFVDWEDYADEYRDAADYIRAQACAAIAAMSDALPSVPEELARLSEMATGGEWRYTGHAEDHRGNPCVTDPHNLVVAVTLDDGKDADEVEANAAFIAAASNFVRQIIRAKGAA